MQMPTPFTDRETAMAFEPPAAVLRGSSCAVVEVNQKLYFVKAADIGEMVVRGMEPEVIRTWVPNP